MEIEEIEIFIKPDGEVSYEVCGVKGKRCLDITKEIELELGGGIIERKETAEMYENDVVFEESENELSEKDK